MACKVIATGKLVIHTRLDCGERMVLALEGELDMAGAAALASLLEAEAAGHDVVVDLARLESMHCSGVRTLVEARARYAGEGRQFTLLQGPRQVQQVVEKTSALEGP